MTSTLYGEKDQRREFNSIYRSKESERSMKEILDKCPNPIVLMRNEDLRSVYSNMNFRQLNTSSLVVKQELF